MQMGFIEDLVLVIVKGYMPLSIVGNPWLKQMVLHLCGQVRFPSHKQLVCEYLPILLLIIMEVCMFLAISWCVTVITTFDLWMSRLGYDIFALVINSINQSWVLCHTNVGLF